MIYTKNLEELIFHRHEMIAGVDELTVLSGYIGPSPVQRLVELPFPTKVIYGMYGSEGIKPTLHNALLKVHKSTEHVDIYYSQMPIHAKTYTWLANHKIVHALTGSANFSVSGLRTPYREILAETTKDSFDGLNEYIKKVMNNSISCLEAEAKKRLSFASECFLSLVQENGEVQNAAGLNWGQNLKNHTNPSDAYIPIRTQDIRNFPRLFPPKQKEPISFDGRGRPHRNNDSIEIMWDDGTNMEGLLMGTQTIDGVDYPKQISSFPKAKDMGLYFRKRLGVPPKDPVRKHHLDSYGRNNIQVDINGEGVYSFDFSRPDKS